MVIISRLWWYFYLNVFFNGGKCHIAYRHTLPSQYGYFQSLALRHCERCFLTSACTFRYKHPNIFWHLYGDLTYWVKNIYYQFQRLHHYTVLQVTVHIYQGLSLCTWEGIIHIGLLFFRPQACFRSMKKHCRRWAVSMLMMSIPCVTKYDLWNMHVKGQATAAKNILSMNWSASKWYDSPTVGNIYLMTSQCVNVEIVLLKIGQTWLNITQSCTD